MTNYNKKQLELNKKNIQVGDVFITEANLLNLIISKDKKGRVESLEISNIGNEIVEFCFDGKDTKISSNGNIVYGVIDSTGKIVKDKTSFYFKKGFAQGITKELNKHIANKNNKHKIKKFILIEL